MLRAYSCAFPHGYRCVFEISLTATEMKWTPTNPSRGARWIRQYRRWRDRCIRDYADRTGVLHVIVEDDVYRGVRFRHTVGLTPEGQYSAMAALRKALLAPGRESEPGVTDNLLRDVQEQMLYCAPRSAGGTA